MTGLDLVFLVVALITAAAAIMTVTSHNLVHAALYLAVTLAGIAGVFLVLSADFLALVQLVVYVGAVAVLFLFGLMLTRAPIGREALDSQHRGLALGVSVTLFVLLSTLIIGAFGDVRVDTVAGPRTPTRAGAVPRLGAALRGALDAAARGARRCDRALAARGRRVRRASGRHADPARGRPGRGRGR
jgi:NADH-quinone oxidoreductase subunit J